MLAGPVSGLSDVLLLSVEQEGNIGAEEAKKVEVQMGLLNDTQFRPYLDILGQRLAKESPHRDVTHQLHIVDSGQGHPTHRWRRQPGNNRDERPSIVPTVPAFSVEDTTLDRKLS